MISKMKKAAPLDSDAADDHDFETVKYDSDSVVATLPGTIVRVGGGLVVLEGEAPTDRFVFTLGQARSLATMSRPRDPAFANALDAAIDRAKNVGARMRDA